MLSHPFLRTVSDTKFDVYGTFEKKESSIIKIHHIFFFIKSKIKNKKQKYFTQQKCLTKSMVFFIKLIKKFTIDKKV